MESIISNARHAVGDNCVLTTCYQCIGCCLDNGIAVITTIVFCIATFYYHRGEGGATNESQLSNARYAVGDSHRGEGGAIPESIISNARYAVEDTAVNDGFGNGGGG